MSEQEEQIAKLQSQISQMGRAFHALQNFVIRELHDVRQDVSSMPTAGTVQTPTTPDAGRHESSPPIKPGRKRTRSQLPPRIPDVIRTTRFPAPVYQNEGKTVEHHPVNVVSGKTKF